MINLQDVESKKPIIKDFYTWLFDDNRINIKNIDLKNETDLTLAPYYMDSNIYFPGPIHDFFQTKAMKRLGRISQLSLVANDYPVYHTRLEHSKGAYNRCLEEMLYNFQNPDWKNFIEKNHMKLYVLANLIKVAGHDIGHLPLSHVLEETIYHTHDAHEILGKRIMLENEEIQNILFSVSADLPELLKDLFEKDILNFNIHSEGNYDVDRLDYLSRDSLYLGFPKDIKTLPYETVQVESDNGYSFVDVYNYEYLKDIEDFLDLRFSLYQNIYMSEKNKMYESAVGTFVDAFLSTDSECGKELQNFILQLKNSDVKTCDLSTYLNWDDISFYSQVLEIGENHENPNIRDLSTMIIPNMDSFLNMIYYHFDIKNNQSFSSEDMVFLKKIKHLIKSDSQFSKNIRNSNFVKQNSLISTNNISLSSYLNTDLVYIFSYNLRAYKKKNPIYVRDKLGKIYELSEHPERRYDWNEQKTLLQREYCYIPFLKFNGFNEIEIDKLRSIFSPTNPEPQHPDILATKKVNMNSLRVGHNIEDCFLEL